MAAIFLWIFKTFVVIFPIKKSEIKSVMLASRWRFEVKTLSYIWLLSSKGDEQYEKQNKQNFEISLKNNLFRRKMKFWSRKNEFRSSQRLRLERCQTQDCIVMSCSWMELNPQFCNGCKCLINLKCQNSMGLNIF